MDTNLHTFYCKRWKKLLTKLKIEILVLGFILLFLQFVLTITVAILKVSVFEVMILNFFSRFLCR